MKRFLSFLLIFVLILSMPCFAAASTPTEDETVSPQVLYTTYPLDSSACHDIYVQFRDASADWTDATGALADCLSLGGYYKASVAVTIGNALIQIHFNTVMSACYKGWQNDKGATVYIYTDAVPTILPNN